MTALNEEHTIDFFISPMALFVVEFTEIKEIAGDSVKEALRNRMRPQMAVLLRAGGRRDSTLGTSGGYREPNNLCLIIDHSRRPCAWGDSHLCHQFNTRGARASGTHNLRSIHSFPPSNEYSEKIPSL